MAKKKIEPVKQPEPEVVSNDVPEPPATPVPTENQIILSRLAVLVANFEAAAPAASDGSGEDVAGKKYNDKTAQIGGVLLAAYVSVKEIANR